MSIIELAPHQTCYLSVQGDGALVPVACGPSLDVGQLVLLVDGRSRLLGRVTIETIRGDLVLGRFAAGPDFEGVESLFTAFVESANQQLFHHVDELDRQIAALQLHLLSEDGAVLPPIGDVQIGGSNISFRTSRSSVPWVGC
jgi:hypothetical protein